MCFWMKCDWVKIEEIKENWAQKGSSYPEAKFKVKTDSKILHYVDGHEMKEHSE